MGGRLSLLLTTSGSGSSNGLAIAQQIKGTLKRLRDKHIIFMHNPFQVMREDDWERLRKAMHRHRLQPFKL